MRHAVHVVLLICMFFLLVVSCEKSPTRSRLVTISATVNFTVWDNGTCVPNATIVVYSYFSCGEFCDDFRVDTLYTNANGKASIILTGKAMTGKASFSTEVSKDGYQTLKLESETFENNSVINKDVNLLKVAR